MYALPGYCGDCRQLTTFLIWFYNGHNGTKHRVKRQCIKCEVILDKEVEQDNLTHLHDPELDEFEKLIMSGEDEFYVLVRHCPICCDMTSLVILSMSRPQKVHCRCICVSCRSLMELNLTEKLFNKLLHKIKIVGVRNEAQPKPPCRSD